MDSQKPIEPGCLALVLPKPRPVWGDESLTGSIVLVVKDYGGTFYPPDGRAGILRSWDVTLDNEGYVCSEDLLMRIDDPDIQKQIETEREKEHA